MGASGGVLGRLGVVLRPSWGRLGRSWGHPGAVLGGLGRSWGHLGTVLGGLGVVLGHLVRKDGCKMVFISIDIGSRAKMSKNPRFF